MSQAGRSTSLDAERYRRAREIFDDLVERDPAVRDAAVHDACDGDEALEALVLRLMSFDTQAGLLDTVEGVGLPEIVVVTAAVEGMPEQLGGFRVVRELGRGGMGVVYEAEQERPHRRVAIKTLMPLTRSAEAESLFATEVDALARVLHPGIPQIYEVFEVDGVPYMAMEFVDGVPLLHAVFLLDLPERAKLLADIADAVEHAHRRGVIHRDLKPANVLVTADGQAKVLDFGIARLDASYKPGIGTLVYMAPEQFGNEPPVARSDVYSLGAMAWELITGVPPFADAAGSTQALLRAKATHDAPGLPDDTPPALAAEIRRALSPFVQDRHPTADAFAQAMRRVAAGEKNEAVSTSSPEPTPVPTAAASDVRRAALLGSTLMVLVAIAVGVAWWLS